MYFHFLLLTCFTKELFGVAADPSEGNECRSLLQTTPAIQQDATQARQERIGTDHITRFINVSFPLKLDMSLLQLDGRNNTSHRVATPDDGEFERLEDAHKFCVSSDSAKDPTVDADGEKHLKPTVGVLRSGKKIGVVPMQALEEEHHKGMFCCRGTPPLDEEMVSASCELATTETLIELPHTVVRAEISDIAADIAHAANFVRSLPHGVVMLTSVSAYNALLPRLNELDLRKLMQERQVFIAIAFFGAAVAGFVAPDLARS